MAKTKYIYTTFAGKSLDVLIGEDQFLYKTEKEIYNPTPIYWENLYNIDGIKEQLYNICCVENKKYNMMGVKIGNPKLIF